MQPPTAAEVGALGRLLRSLREGVGLTVRELSRRVGVTHTTLSRFERGERIVSAETLDRIAYVIAEEIAARRAA